jgi:putative chitinase
MPVSSIPGIAAALAAAAPRADQATWIPALTPALIAADIVSPRRVSAFLGQCAVEAGSGFTHLAEDLFYTTAARVQAVYPSHVSSLADAGTLCRSPARLANRVYANRLGNGPESSGDGFLFSGHGLIQLTGRDAWAAFGKARGLTPAQAVAFGMTPAGAAASATWFWTTRGLNLLADGWQLTNLTTKVNGPAKLGLQDRITASNAALAAMGGH